jgi:hypothetical protein
MHRIGPFSGRSSSARTIIEAIVVLPEPPLPLTAIVVVMIVLCS